MHLIHFFSLRLCGPITIHQSLWMSCSYRNASIIRSVICNLNESQQYCQCCCDRKIISTFWPIRIQQCSAVRLIVATVNKLIAAFFRIRMYCFCTRVHQIGLFLAAFSLYTPSLQGKPPSQTKVISPHSATSSPPLVCYSWAAIPLFGPAV